MFCFSLVPALAARQLTPTTMKERHQNSFKLKTPRSLPSPLPRTLGEQSMATPRTRQETAPPKNTSTVSADQTEPGPTLSNNSSFEAAPDILGLFTENVVKEHGKFFIYNKTKLEPGDDAVEEENNQNAYQPLTLDLEKINQIASQLKQHQNIQNYKRIQQGQLGVEPKKRKWGKNRRREPSTEHQRAKRKQEIDEYQMLIPEDYRLTDMVLTCENNKIFAEQQISRLDELDLSVDKIERQLDELSKMMAGCREQAAELGLREPEPLPKQII